MARPTRAGTSRPWNSPRSWSAKSAPACAPFVPDANARAQERTRITRASLNRPKALGVRHALPKARRITVADVLISGQRHLQSLLAQYVAHYNERRPIAVASSTRPG